MYKKSLFGIFLAMIQSVLLAQQWQPVLSGVLINKFIVSPSYADDGIIYAIDEVRGLYRSADRGLNWANVYEPADMNDPSEWIVDMVISPDFANDQTLLLIVGEGYGFLKRSTNGGSDWSYLPTPGNEVVQTIAFSSDYSNDQTIFCWTFSGVAKFWKTTDPANGWSFVSVFYIPLEFDYLKSAGGVSNNQSLFSGVTIGAHLLRSIDNGVSNDNISGWTGASELLDFDVSSGFANDSTLFAAVHYSDQSNVMYNVHGGDPFAWQICYSTTQYVAGLSLSPYFLSDHTLIIGVEPSGVFLSPNGGDSWSEMNDGLLNYHMLSVLISEADPFEAFASTYLTGALPDKIWKFSKDSLTGINDQVTEPVWCVLLKNYPNPFNKATTLTWKLLKDMHVALKVYDFTGREITTLVDCEQAMGEHSVKFDATGLPAGVYFYQLQANGKVETKKMIVLK